MSNSLDWKPISSAPAGKDLEVSFYDAGEYHALAYPCQLDEGKWRDRLTKRIIDIRPTHWRMWRQPH